MRVLLAALTAPTGEVAGNLERHAASGEVTRLPDWWPGTPTVAVPVDAAASGRVAPRR